MKKTVSINIKGLHFIIEEQAYEKLQAYLDRLENKLGNTEGKQEIIEDIELRMAEIFTENLNNNHKKVIEMVDVEAAISILGEPEDYIEGEETKSSAQESIDNEKYSYDRHDKKLFRDLENAVIAGVCSGLANYFAIDVIIVRIIFLLVLFFGGFGIPLYIILWIIVPKVSSHIDRLRMQGRPITVENVREEVETAAQRMSYQSEKFARKMQRESTFQRGMGSAGRAIRVIIGLFFMMFGISAIIGFLSLLVLQIGVFPVSGDDGLYDLYSFANLFWDHPEELQVIYYGGMLVSIVLICWILVTAVRFIFDTPMGWYKFISRTALFAFIIGIVLCFYGGATFGKEFSFESEIEKDLNPVSNSLYLEVTDKTAHTDGKGKVRIRERHHMIFAEKNGRIHQVGVPVRYIQTEDSVFRMRVVYKAHGSTQTEAFDNARHIQYDLQQKGDTLYIPKSFNYPTKDKIRNQRVKVFIEVPRNKVFYVNGKELKLERDTDDDDEDLITREMYIDEDEEYNF
ncbi:MAG: PspC domain-containing protein [Crocinitomicaceae bacterium]|jgi:phage shock protein PspC (stress-responsive transcriptional regulator)|nr:PspC domain-containing protein [Crocinitomicaceae bacterium]